jgi:hypothetical protein
MPLAIVRFIIKQKTVKGLRSCFVVGATSKRFEIVKSTSVLLRLNSENTPDSGHCSFELLLATPPL